MRQTQEEIAAETRQALNAIKEQVAELAVAATEKVVRARLDEAEQRRLIDEALGDVDLSTLAPPALRRTTREWPNASTPPRTSMRARCTRRPRRPPRARGRPRPARAHPGARRPASRAARAREPGLPRAAKHRILAKLLEGSEPLARNAVLVLSEHGRLALLVDLQLAYAELAADDDQILAVTVTTAVELTKELDALAKRISDAVGRTAEITATIDPDLIGGLVLRAHDVLVDASIKRRLEDAAHHDPYTIARWE